MKKRNPFAKALRLSVLRLRKIPPKRGNKSYSRKVKHKNSAT